MDRVYQVLPPHQRPRKLRRAVRVLVVAGAEVLLFADSDPGLPEFAWWVTPGGGIDPGETERQAAVRELAEETGLQAAEGDLIGPLGHRVVVHGYSDEILEQAESFWLLDTDRFDVSIAGHTEEERVTLQGNRWWPLDDLATTTDWVWPAELRDLLAVGRGLQAAAAGGPRPEPLQIGRVLLESTQPVADYDAIVLGGGRGRRLGGVSKPDLVIDGERLLDRALRAVSGASCTVVVAAPEVDVPAGVRRILEDPPLGGPVAGVAAGLVALAEGRVPADIVVVLACDMPGIGTAVPRLVDALIAAPGADGACLAAEPGRREWLAAAYRRSVLPTGDVHGHAMRAAVADVRLVEVPAAAAEVHDIDTVADLGG